MNEENSDTPIENEEAKSLLSGEESIAKNQPLSNDNLPSQTIHYTEKPKSTFEKTLGVLNVLFTLIHHQKK
jgi:hypothetical protein